MFAALSGVASFHRACLLAQDFTHEPACQTGESAPQGRFRHQPEQMVHPPFAWQLASFPSLPVCGEEAPYCPLRNFATLRAYSPEIKAQQAIFAFLPVYPELVALIGGIVPNYRGYFLRGVGGSSAALGVEQQDAMQRITGGIRTAPQKTDEVGDNTWGAYYVSATGRGCNVYRTGDNAWSYKDTVFDSARVVRTAEETRPLNRAVRYLIRAR